MDTLEKQGEIYSADKIGALLKEVGFRGPRRETTPERERAMGKMVRLIAAASWGDSRAKLVLLDKSLLQEVLTTSDFPLLFADSIDRQLLAAYARFGAEWKKHCKITKIADFRQAKRFKMDLGSRTLPLVLEKGEYLPIDVDETEYHITLAKYGSQIDFSWETFSQVEAC